MKKDKIKKDKGNESLKVSNTTKDLGGDVLPDLEAEAPKTSNSKDVPPSDVTSSIGEVIAASTGGVGKTGSAPKQDRSYGKSGKRDGNHEFRSKNGNSKVRRDDRSGKSTNKEHTTTKPTDSKTNKFIQIGDLYPKRENKTLLDYTIPSQKELNLLISSPILAPYEDRFQEYINTNLRRVQNSPYVGDLILLRQAIKDTTKLHFTVYPYLVGSVKGDDTMVAVAFYSNESRILELNQPRVTLDNGGEDGITDMFGDKINLTDNQQGASVSGYPNSSLADNDVMRVPYTPNVLDEIHVVDLDGGAFIRKGNILERTIAWDSSSQFVIPGATGYNYYKSETDSAGGILTPHYKKVEDYRGIKHILIGEEFKSSKTNSVLSGNTTTKSSAVINTDGYFGNLSVSLSDKQKQGGIVDPYDYFNRADLQFAILSLNFLKYYNLHIKYMNDTAGDNPYRDRLAGFTDKQAFFYALASGIRFGTFMRCLLYAFDYAWISAPFTATKTGVMNINDQFLRNMPPAGRKGRTDFLAYMKTVLNIFPFNKNAYEAFKLKLKSSMLTDKLDVYSENNPLVSIRVVFSAMEDVGLLKEDAVIDFTADFKKDRSILFPHTKAAQVATGTGTDPITKIADITKLNINPFGNYVKSLITQLPIWVPHGDLLTLFINYFRPFLFYSRLPDALPSAQINGNRAEDVLKDLLDPTMTLEEVLAEMTATGGAKRGSLTAIFDPKNMTGFLTNFISFGYAGTAMKEWVMAAIEINQPFYTYMRELYNHPDNKETGNASICFDDNVEFNFNQEDATSVVAAPKYDISVINSIIYQTRVFGKVKALGTGITLDLTNVGPFMPNQTYRNINLNLADLQPTDYAQLPRVSLSLPNNTSNYTFGVKGDILYDGQAPWARSSDIIQNMFSSSIITALNPRWKKLLMSGAYVPTTTINRPFDLYNYYYYPSFSAFVYRPLSGIQIVPGYDYDYHKPGLFSAIIQSITDTSFWPGRKDESFNYLNPITGDYEEIYDVDEFQGDKFIKSHPAASSIRLIFGSLSRKLVKSSQWITTVSPGGSNSDVLKSRYNAVSIFTANNIKTIGIANSGKHLDNMNNSDTYYYIYYTQVFQNTFGFLSNPFIEIGSGGSLPLNVHSQVTPWLKHRVQSSDLDLSIKFGNIDSIVLGLRAGLKDGETYPVVSGFGHDIIAHPEDQRSYKDPFGAESPKTNK